jgi:hypothetical protein
MASRLTVIFYIILCLMSCLLLTVLPWWQPRGMGDWGDNYFLVFAAQKMGIVGLQRAVASGWVRGAVTGLGLLNLAMALWEIFHFRETVHKLEGLDRSNVAAPTSTDYLPQTDADDAAQAARTDNVSHHERRDD